MGSDRARILMLHRVLEDTPTAFGLPGSYRMRGTALTAGELERVLDDASPILGLDAVEHALSVGQAPPAGCVLTFDDGYREHLDLVAPMLAARGVTATFYVATGLHGDTSAVAFVDAWYWLLDHAEQGAAYVPMPDGGVYRGRVDTPAGKADWVGGEPKAAMLAATPAQRTAMLASLADSTGCALPLDLAARLYLRPREWSALASLGMRVGAHSVLHPRLTQVDDAELQAEVRGSIDTIGQLGGPVAFAYPDGAYDERVVREVRQANASSSVTCEAGTVGKSADRWRLPRVFIQPESARTGSWMRSP